MRKTGGVAIVKVKRVTGVDVSREWIIDKLETGKKNRTKKIPSSVCVSESGSEKKKGCVRGGVWRGVTLEAREGIEASGVAV